METTQKDNNRALTGKLSAQAKIQEKIEKEFRPDKTTVQDEELYCVLENHQEEKKAKVPVQKQWDIE